jgi:hypothetical protein
MRLLRRRRDQHERNGRVAVAEGRLAIPETVEVLRSRLTALEERYRAHPDRQTERELLRLRHLAGIKLMDEAPANPQFISPSTAALRVADPLPAYPPTELTPELLRAGILRDGCVLVRGLVPQERARAFADGIEQAYIERERVEAGDDVVDGFYEEMPLQDRFENPGRGWIKMGGGLLAADSPRLCAEMIQMFREASLPRIVSDYLGEPALISTHKTTLRKAEPQVGGAWHQDGFFMGPVRALNLWLSLSRCGDVAPGLDIVPRRIEDYLATGTSGAQLSWTISEEKVAEAAALSPVVRPIFEPGDALFFDEVFLHKTGSDPSMPKPRFAIENWFFGGSAFPAEYAPLAV